MIRIISRADANNNLRDNQVKSIFPKPSNKSLDASGGSVFLNLLGAAKGALIRAAASTQPLCLFF
jgi:hypothetical protein